ncbi:MAG TPA: nucleotidyltransferase domain-containing protein [Gaiellaceae bacterium]|jgi:predicted nucleotidyltransferase
MKGERAYLDELTRRLKALLGDELVGVYAGGSYALGGYEPGRSDLDVAAVVREGLPEGMAEQIIAAVRHEALPSPARKLELVIYDAEAARSASVEPGFELNLNTGADEFRADLEPRPGEGHWFAIDRSVLAGHGVALAGPPANEVFASPPRDDLLPVLADVLRWYLREEPDSEDAMLNAGRSLRFAHEGVWAPKPALREWAREQTGTRREVERAIAELEDGLAG